MNRDTELRMLAQAIGDLAVEIRKQHPTKPLPTLGGVMDIARDLERRLEQLPAGSSSASPLLSGNALSAEGTAEWLRFIADHEGYGFAADDALRLQHAADLLEHHDCRCPERSEWGAGMRCVRPRNHDFAHITPHGDEW